MKDYYESHRDELIRLYHKYINDKDPQIQRRATHHIKYLLEPEDLL